MGFFCVKFCLLLPQIINNLDFLHLLLELITNTKDTLVEIIGNYQGWTYLIISLIIFGETGLVVTPFLPGDSLLFAIGALIAQGDTGLNIYLMAVLLVFAAIFGNTVNYRLGAYFGAQVFKPGNKILKLKYYHQAHAYFEKHGARAVIFSRFLPIFRTIVPFVAGTAKMDFGKYSLNNIIGGVLWIVLLLFGGYLLGKIPFVEKNFELLIVAIAVFTFVPVIVAALKAFFQKK